MNALEHFELWLALIRGELTEDDAARRWDMDVAAVRRIRQVAEQGAIAALSTAAPEATAQVTVSTAPADAAGGRVLDVFSKSPVFIGVARDRLEQLTRDATLVFLGDRTPISDWLSAGPLLVSQGTLMAVDHDDRPVDLVGRGAYRAPSSGRRFVPLGPTYVAALPAAAVEDAGAVARNRLAVGAPLGGAHDAAVQLPSAAPGAVVLGDLIRGAALRVEAHETVASVIDRLGGGPQTVLVEGGSARPLVLRAAALSLSADADAPVRSLAAHSLVDETVPCLARRTPLIGALVRMLETGAAAVAVTDSDDSSTAGARGRVVGAVSVEDLPLPEEAGVADLLTRLGGDPTVERLATVPPAAHTFVRSMLIAGTDVADAGRLLAAVSDQLMRQLLMVARSELGPPPGDFAWLVFGSHARRELTPGSDQDTGLVYSAGLEAEGHDWYARLGAWMTEALEACGFARCPGGVMASRSDWRHDIVGWQHAIRRWTNPTETSQLIGADIGLDVRAVAGTGDLQADHVAGRLARMVSEASRSELTAARLARAAVARRPPSATWGKVGRNPLGPPLSARQRRFDVKRHGIQPIVDLARLHTLVGGGTEISTTERLAAAAAAGALSTDLAATLVEGLRLLTWTRMSAQLSGPDAAASDHVDWTTLPVPLRNQFSDTFGAIRFAQDALRARYRLAPGM